MKSIWVVIPAHNEAKYIPTVLQKVRKFTKNIVVVDDGSSDETALLAKKFTRHVFRHEVNLGKGAALRTGCEYIFDTLDADGVIFFDADDQHDAREIPNFIKALKNTDFVFGVRKLGTSVPLMRFLGNKLASITLNFLFKAYIPDIPSGYKAMTRNVYKKLKWKSSGYEVEAEIAVLVAKDKIPYKVLEIEAIYHDTEKGMTLLDAIYVALHIIQWRMGL